MQASYPSAEPQARGAAVRRVEPRSGEPRCTSNVVRLTPLGGGSTGASPASGERAPGGGGEAGGGSRRGAHHRGGEAEIAEAIRAGDHRQALVLCARHHGAVIGRLCMSLTGSQADAEDITQETLLDAHSGLSGWRGEGSARAWLLSIARRKCARHLEKKNRRGAKLRLIYDRDRDGAPDSSRSEQAVLLRQRAERARAALAKLRPSEREALLLRYSADLSYREISQACGVDEAAARKRVSRAVATLRGTLQDQEGSQP